MTAPVPVGTAAAGHILHVPPPPLRVRYRQGVYINRHGYPDWLPYAAAMVRIAPVPPGFTADEARLVDVLIANRLAARALDAMEEPTGTRDAPPRDETARDETARDEAAPDETTPDETTRDETTRDDATPDDATPDGTQSGAAETGSADRTPAGWVWAHIGQTRRLALVPAELHTAFRHRGGVSDMRDTVAGRGLLAGEGDDAGDPVRFQAVRPVSEEAIQKLEGWLGYRLPDGYREFLAATNGGVPLDAAVLRCAGLLLDQPLFGLAAEDRMQDLAYANLWLRDRLTRDFLGIGYVQGGLLVLKVRGPDAGSVWYWDDDDPRDDDRYGPDDICRELLVPCAPDFDGLLAALSTVPPSLSAVADGAIESGQAQLFRPDGMGEALPKSRRPLWFTPTASAPAADRTAPPD